MVEYYSWEGKEALKGKKLCSACAPSKHSDGTSSGLGEWHGKFERIFLPLGKFKTNRRGNLEYIETGDEDYRKYAINEPAAIQAARLLQAHELWEAFGNVPVNDDDEIESSFLEFKEGTGRMDIWHWFEREFNCSVAKDLMGLH